MVVDGHGGKRGVVPEHGVQDGAASFHPELAHLGAEATQGGGGEVGAALDVAPVCGVGGHRGHGHELPEQFLELVAVATGEIEQAGLRELHGPILPEPLPKVKGAAGPATVAATARGA